ncbi:WD40-repeat-containing domain protein [Mucor lusitanicus]|uniref:WD40-repeat-containing domain protein n=1 Tax=Mucor circinelloides f. lusitanicus TaxID=29924 RepID=A0A8H4F569_MUCCL|nr:WD40-repeat-containing domain protein [Mucor lusitanicus]
MTLTRQSSRSKLDTKPTTTRPQRVSKRINSSEEDLQPAKRHKAATSDHQTSAKKTPSQPTTRRAAPQKLTVDKSNLVSLGKKKATNTTPSKAPKKTTKKTTPKGRTVRKKLPLLDGSYTLKHVLKGHTEFNVPVRDKNDTEDSKDIWCCEFEPVASDVGPFDQQKPGELQSFALCGSYTVLFADPALGKYTKKYTHSEIQEIFYCMAWTRLEGEELLDGSLFDDGDEVSHCNVLAVAGRLGSVKLLNPLQNDCYRYLFGHQKAILAMTFAKTEPRWLFTASADKTVRLWDIGSPTKKMDDSLCLAEFILPPKSGDPSAVSISYDLSRLIVGCNNGDMIEFNLSTSELDEYRQTARDFRSDKTIETEHHAIPHVNSAMKYPAGDEWHEGYVDDVCIIGQDGNEKSALYNTIVSRGSADMEILVWDPANSTRTDADIKLSLDWPDAADCTGLKFKVIEAAGQKVLLAGDYDGQIFIYDIGNQKESKTLEDGSKEQFKPKRVSMLLAVNVHTSLTGIM